MLPAKGIYFIGEFPLSLGALEGDKNVICKKETQKKDREAQA
jgi:hypothetical protein